MNRPVLVFRTSVSSAEQVSLLRPALECLLASHDRWTIDLEDRDRVLRIESAAASPPVVMGVLQAYGHECSELE